MTLQRPSLRRMALVLIAAIGLSAFTAAIVVMNRFGARVWLLALM